MLQDDFEERLDALTKKVDELAEEVAELKQKRAEKSGLIPGAEYDLVPTYVEKVVFRGKARIVGFAKPPEGLGLSPREWELLTPDEQCHE